MSWHEGGEVRCASATYAGRFVIDRWGFSDGSSALQVGVSGNARQRRRRVRKMRRAGFLVTPGGVAS